MFNSKPACALRGFTLFELLIAIAVLGILLGAGIPGFSNFIAKANAKGAAQQLYASYQFARAEAIKRGKVVHFCGSNNGTDCSEIWHESLLIFVDENDNQQVEPDELIRAIDFNHQAGHIHSNFSRGDLAAHLKPNGRSENTGSIIYCNSKQPEHSRKITFYYTGRPYFSKLRLKNGVLKDIKGNTVDCSA